MMTATAAATKPSRTAVSFHSRSGRAAGCAILDRGRPIHRCARPSHVFTAPEILAIHMTRFDTCGGELRAGDVAGLAMAPGAVTVVGVAALLGVVLVIGLILTPASITGLV